MFEIEEMKKTFDYSLVDNETADKLKKYDRQLNMLYNNYTIEVGEILFNANKEFSNPKDGTFIKWVEYKGFKRQSAYNYMNIYKAFQSLESIDEQKHFLSQSKSLQYEMSKPSANKKANQAVFSGDIKTHKEYKELERQLKQREQQNAQLQSQMQQAQRSEQIALQKLENAQNKAPEVIEREVVKEVVPDDVKRQLEQFKQKFERESNNANELRDELEKYRNSFSDPNQAYEEKELYRLERESSINAHKIAISIQNFIKENSVETYRLDTIIKANPKSKERLEENVALLKEFTSNLEAMLNGRIIVN